MREQHLSDEAVAAFADDVLSGHARERARRHTASCPECNHAVAVQREAVWALRAAPAPSLPSGLLDRLRDVPATTPLARIPTHVDENGTTMFPAFGAAAFVPPNSTSMSMSMSARSRLRRARPLAVAVASVAVVGALAATASADTGKAADPAAPRPSGTDAGVGTGGAAPGLIRADLPLHPW
jgi:anti-sigma factor RsiW